MKSLLMAEALDFLETLAPQSFAESWDTVGVSVSRKLRGRKLQSAVVALDLSPAVLKKCRAVRADLLVIHHPPIFGKAGLYRLSEEAPESALVLEAYAMGLTVLSLHTNYDRAVLEGPLSLAKALGVEVQGRLSDQESFLKLQVYVPESHLEGVREALAEVGVGRIGQYDSCSFSMEGEGTYRPLPGSTPFQGTEGRLERARERKLEMLLPQALKGVATQALLKAHPYEEVAMEFFPVTAKASGVAPGVGYGFYGDFPRAIRTQDWVSKLRKALKLRPGEILLTPSERSRRGGAWLRRVGFVPGKGSSFLEAARRVGCDLFLSGELGYHATKDSAARGVATCEVGHLESERRFMPTISAHLRAFARGKGVKLRVFEIYEKRQVHL
jgi:putative NIF3 family GTP cyclohydrolase 1 type 2